MILFCHLLKVRGRYQIDADFSRTLAEAGKILSLLVRVCLLIRTETEKIAPDQIRLDFSELKIKKKLLPEQTHLNKISICDSVHATAPAEFFCLRLFLPQHWRAVAKSLRQVQMHNVLLQCITAYQKNGRYNKLNLKHCFFRVIPSCR